MAPFGVIGGDCINVYSIELCLAACQSIFFIQCLRISHCIGHLYQRSGNRSHVHVVTQRQTKQQHVSNGHYAP